MNGPAQFAQTTSEVAPMSVLVVDDEEGMREGIRRILDRNGYHVTTAEDGEQAIARLEECTFDIALVDLKMPGIDGFQVTRHISDTCSGRTVIVIVSAFASIQAAVEVAKHGAFDFLVKPFAPEDLLQVMARASQQRRLIRERDLFLSELNSEQNLSRQLINSMSEGVVVLNINRKPVLMNPWAESLLGVSYREDMELQDLGLDHAALALIDGMYCADPQCGTIHHVCCEHGGQRFDLHAAPYMRGPDLAGLILFLRDATEE